MVIPLQGFSRNDCSVQDESEFRPRTVPMHCPVFAHLYSQKVASVGLAACKTLLYKKRYLLLIFWLIAMLFHS